MVSGSRAAGTFYSAVCPLHPIFLHMLDVNFVSKWSEIHMKSCKNHGKNIFLRLNCDASSHVDWSLGLDGWVEDWGSR